MRVRETRHGPVIDDFMRRADDLTPQGHVLALQATALDGNDTSAEGFGRLGLAQNWEDFLAAARKIVSPMQNMVYADTAGNIGLVSPARVPIRRKGDGSMPVPGWTSDFDWAGFVPFDELPRVYNPPSGIIVNWKPRCPPPSAITDRSERIVGPLEVRVVRHGNPGIVAGRQHEGRHADLGHVGERRAQFIIVLGLAIAVARRDETVVVLPHAARRRRSPLLGGQPPPRPASRS